MGHLFCRLVDGASQREQAERTVRLHRSRWAAVGAAIAVTVGSGGLLSTSASIGSGERGVYVPIAPCRLFDTRPAPDNVGPRNTPLGPGDTFIAVVLGTNGNCSIPTDAVGLTMNVAIINPSSSSFLTVFPDDVARPLAANANWTANQPPLSNSVTADIGASGRVAFYNLAGTVDIAADIVGYYIDHTHDDRYYTKAEVDTAIASTYTKSESDGRYYTKADADARYATTAVADALARRSGARVGVDTLGSVGGYSSIAIGADGLPVIAYLDDAAADLKVAKCVNVNCTGTATITTVDATGSVGFFPSVAVGADGNPVIAYLDATNNDLKVAKCANPACTGPTTRTTIDATGVVGYYPSIAIGFDGNPVIAYYDITSLDLNVAKCANPACTGNSEITVVDASGDVGAYTSIAMRADGNPVISYLDQTNLDLKVAACANPACSGTATTTAVDTGGSVGYYSSIEIAADGNPIVAHFDAVNLDLRVTHCANPTCVGVSVSTAVDTVGSVGQFLSMAIGVDGLPVISYGDGTAADLKFAACGSIGCTGAASISSVESVSQVGYYTSVAIGVDGAPIISHQDLTNADLRVMKCSTLTCAT